jgi:predicted RNA binding protein YcfA (HicA-like mRNA interferase family)
MSPKFPRLTAAELLRALRRAGWQESRQRGSHRRLEHHDRPGQMVTLAVHTGKTVPIGTLKAILEAAGLSSDDLRELL